MYRCQKNTSQISTLWAPRQKWYLSIVVYFLGNQEQTKNFFSFLLFFQRFRLPWYFSKATRLKNKPLGPQSNNNTLSYTNIYYVINEMQKMLIEMHIQMYTIRLLHIVIKENLGCCCSLFPPVKEKKTASKKVPFKTRQCSLSLSAAILFHQTNIFSPKIFFSPKDSPYFGKRSVKHDWKSLKWHQHDRFFGTPWWSTHTMSFLREWF